LCEFGNDQLILDRNLSVHDGVIPFDEADDFRFDLQWKFIGQIDRIRILDYQDSRLIRLIEKGFEQFPLVILIANG
jgi:hypothetical protein